MKKITTKVIMLMLVIPVLLIFTMVSAISVTPIMVDIPVTSINIEGEKIIFIDVVQPNNTVKLNTVVTPKEATNKNVSYRIESIDGEMVSVEVSEDGVVTPKSVGSVRVVATADGGREDSVQINFYSSLVNQVNQLTQTINVNVGESKTIAEGNDFTLLPTGVGSNVIFTSESNRIKVDKYTGEITGLFAGQAVVTANIPGIKYDQNLKRFVETIYTLDFDVLVSSNNSSSSVLSFAGGRTQIEEVITLGNKVIPFQYLGYDSLGSLSYEINSEDEEYVNEFKIKYDSNNEGSITIDIDDDAPEKEYLFTIKAGSVNLGSIIIKKQNPTVRISVSRTTYAKSNANVTFGSIVEGIEDGYVVRYESSNGSVFSVNDRDNECVGKAKNVGTSYIKAILYLNGEEIAVSEEMLFTVVDPYISLGIVEGSRTYGLENRFALGKYDYVDNNIVSNGYQLSVVAATGSGAVSTIDEDKLKWVSSDSTIATVTNGLVNVVGEGLVTITVESAYNEALQANVKSSFEINCRSNGLNVRNYSNLMFANDNGYETVLMNNVMLADGINDENYRDYLATVATKQMNTTADKSYYDDNNKTEDAKVRYCVEFTSNVYGNGYFIDGNNITRSIDKYNYSVFNGPLNLVAISYDNNSSSNAKIKAQDNIVFLVKKDGISLNNVELKGCSDSSLIESDQTNLGKLDNCGTVLEIIGDNISLNYSRVNNGRTVVRVYGKPHETDISKITANPNNYKIEFNITNCILSYAREFILKVGSNQVKKNPSVFNDTLALPNENVSKYDHAAPYFTKENGDSYKVNETKDQYFIDNYLMTDINLKDSIFYGTGLFCIGFETQFAGLVLHGYDYSSYKFSQLGWKAVAGTSYPARINMLGDVRFYDWKEINKIDSSTLVEGDSSLLETVGLDLNVSNLLKKFDSANPGNKVVSTYEGKDYINGAVVFYGGGKNYSWLDLSNVNEEFNSLDKFSVPVSYFSDRPNLIYYAAGKEDFFFMTYTNESELSYAKQKNDLADGSAYSWIIRK